jgi:hypothetical protein
MAPVRPCARRWRPLEKKMSVLIGCQARSWRWKQQATASVPQWLRLVQTVLMELGTVQASAPMDPPAATLASLWPATHRRPITTSGGASTSRLSSDADHYIDLVEAIPLLGFNLLQVSDHCGQLFDQGAQDVMQLLCNGHSDGNREGQVGCGRQRC